MSRKSELYKLIDNVDDRPQIANILLVNIPPAILSNEFAGNLCAIINAALAGQYFAIRTEQELYNITENA